MGLATAIVGGVVSLGSAVFGGIQSEKARKDAKKLSDSQGPATNPYALLRPSTIGSSFQGQQSLRTLATSTNALSRAGGRGAALIPQVARQNALVDQNIAAGLDQQQRQVDSQFAQGELIKQNIEEQRFNQQMGGFAQRFAAGQQTMFNGLNTGLNIAASGFSPGGVFTKGQQAQATQQQVHIPEVIPPGNFGSSGAFTPQSLITNGF